MLINFLIDFCNFIIKSLGLILKLIVSILPSSPFSLINNSPIAEYLPTLNFFIPVSEIIAISQVWLLAIGSYYLYQIVLRWIKAIE